MQLDLVNHDFVSNVCDSHNLELKNFGWDTLHLATRFPLDIEAVRSRDTLKREDGLTMTYQQFVDRYEQPNIPVVLTNLTNHWQAQTKWTTTVNVLPAFS
jgi:histone arginine demethylase JMJD6